MDKGPLGGDDFFAGRSFRVSILTGKEETNMEKKKYAGLELEVVALEAEDVITASCDSYIVPGCDPWTECPVYYP